MIDSHVGFSPKLLFFLQFDYFPYWPVALNRPQTHTHSHKHRQVINLSKDEV